MNFDSLSFSVRRHTRRALRRILASFWFLPLALTVSGLALGILLISLQEFVPGELSGLPSFLLGEHTPSGARTVLATVAGAMLSIAATTFSIALAAIVFASGSYGPHILPQYRRDRLVQATLGVFLGNFAYALLGLYAVEVGSYGTPTLLIAVGLALAFIALGMLVLFIGHMIRMLHVSSVIGTTGRLALSLLDRVLPVEEKRKELIDEKQRADSMTELSAETEGKLLNAEVTGYIRAVETDLLLRAAERDDLTIAVLVRPGDYVTPTTPLARVTPGLPSGRSAKQLAQAFDLGEQRSPEQDIAFTLDELSTIAFRALSPGINDPFTAIDVLHQMSAIVDRAARGKPLPVYTSDNDGRIRIRWLPLDFEGIVALSYGRLAPHVATNDTAARTLIELFDRHLNQLNDNHDARHVIAKQADRLRSLIEESDLGDIPKAELLERDDARRRRDRSDQDPGRRRASRLLDEAHDGEPG